MRWSKVRKLVEDRFAASVQGRVHIYSTDYGCTCGRAWITIDGKEIADLNTIQAWPHFGRQGWPLDEFRHPILTLEQRTFGQLVEPGEFTRQQMYEACWAYLHSSIADSLASGDPLIRLLAVLDARVGKRRLRALRGEDLHPLTRALLEFRLSAEHEASAARPEGAADVAQVRP